MTNTPKPKTKKRPAGPVSFKPIGDDLMLLERLEKKLGLGRSSVVRMGLHLLAKREDIHAMAKLFDVPKALLENNGASCEQMYKAAFTKQTRKTKQAS